MRYREVVTGRSCDDACALARGELTVTGDRASLARLGRCFPRPDLSPPT
jgi:hypothetical protein